LKLIKALDVRVSITGEMGGECHKHSPRNPQSTGVPMMPINYEVLHVMKYYISTTQFNCGIDLHARSMYVCLMDRDGNKLLHTNIKNNDFDFFLKRIEPYRHDLTVVCECMFGWYWLAP